MNTRTLDARLKRLEAAHGPAMAFHTIRGNSAAEVDAKVATLIASGAAQPEDVFFRTIYEPALHLPMRPTP